MSHMLNVTPDDFRYSQVLARLIEIQKEIIDFHDASRPHSRDEVLRMRRLRKEWREKNEWVKSVEKAVA